jgi:hypothetical protein
MPPRLSNDQTATDGAVVARTAACERPADLCFEQSQLIAHQCTEAGLGGRAIPYWLRAGEKALQHLANAEAKQQQRVVASPDGVVSANRLQPLDLFGLEIARQMVGAARGRLSARLRVVLPLQNRNLNRLRRWDGNAL